MVGRLHVAMSPLHSAFMLITDALFGAPTVAPHVQHHVVRQLAARAPVTEAFEPMITSGFRAVPDIVAPVAHHLDPTADDHIDQLAAAANTVIDTFAATEHDIPRPWWPVADDPAPWLAAMGRFSRAAWDVVAPLWASAGPLLDQEVGRIGTAVVRGQAESVVNTLSPRLRFVEDTVTVDDRPDASVSLRGRDLVVIPMLAGDATVLVQGDLPDVVQVGYPVPGGSALMGGAKSATTTGVGDPVDGRDIDTTLIGLLGERRAEILHHLDRPRTMRELAGRLGVAAATITHHCDHLEAAGLVQRARHGRSVLASRSDKGAAILDALYAAG